MAIFVVADGLFVVRCVSYHTPDGYAVWNPEEERELTCPKHAM